MVFLRKKPPLKPHTFDPSAYDFIILGAPVWAGAIAPPMETFLGETSLTGKKTALFVCHAGGKGKSLEQLKALLSGSEVTAEADFFNVIKNYEEAAQQIDDWVKNLQNL
jgi:flavodoxin